MSYPLKLEGKKCLKICLRSFLLTWVQSPPHCSRSFRICVEAEMSSKSLPVPMLNNPEKQPLWHLELFFPRHCRRKKGPIICFELTSFAFGNPAIFLFSPGTLPPRKPGRKAKKHHQNEAKNSTEYGGPFLIQCLVFYGSAHNDRRVVNPSSTGKPNTLPFSLEPPKMSK